MKGNEIDVQFIVALQYIFYEPEHEISLKLNIA